MLETLISSKTRVKLLLKFFLNSNTTAYLRSLESEFGESSNGIRVELNRFEKAGLICSDTIGNKKVFKVNTQHPLYRDIHGIIIKMVGLDHVIDYISQRLGDVKLVYLVGKLANGQDSEIIDLVVVGNNINEIFLLEQVRKAERKIDKKIRYVIFDSKGFSIDKVSEPGAPPLLLWSS